MEIENWENTGNELVREVVFENQTALAQCLLEIARYSDRVNHHADMEITQCRKLRLSISTHDTGNLSEKDFDWALGMNALLPDSK